MLDYTKKLRDEFYKHKDEENAAPMEAYMRNQFPFVGMKSPVRKDVFKQFVKKHGYPEKEQLQEAVKELWRMPERELHYAALGLVDGFLKKLEEKDYELLEYMIVNKSWWDTIDHIAANHAGKLFRLYPHLLETVGMNWRQSDNFWLRRTMILYQLKYKGDTNVELLKDIVEENLGSKEFFINKAIGWALREYAKSDPEWVLNVTTQLALSPLSKREALKNVSSKTIKA
ncbi:DNA alkylation repair protein [Fictibacillus iocasae]|uniref:DNA alkylation repair protein n=1 Tax=Fictibacillus iocasae TaxID=2715437 RepID=A0ABW2NL22_9BACL